MLKLVFVVLQMIATSLAGRSWVEKVSTQSIEVVRTPRSTVRRE